MAAEYKTPRLGEILKALCEFHPPRDGNEFVAYINLLAFAKPDRENTGDESIYVSVDLADRVVRVTMPDYSHIELPLSVWSGINK